MTEAATFVLIVNANGSWTLLSRACTRDATGAASPVASEGNLLQQSDLASIAVAVYDPNGATPSTPIYTDTPSAASTISNTLQTTGVWSALTNGGNFLYEFPPNQLTKQMHLYRMLVTLTTNGGTVSFGRFPIKTTDLHP